MNIKNLGKALLAKGKRNAPQIAIITGMVAGGIALVTACIQTTKLSEIVDKSKEELDERQKAVDEGLTRKKEDGTEEPYTQEMADADKKKLKIKTAFRIAKLYALPATFTALSIALIFGGSHMFSTRLAESVAAYNGVVAAYKAAQDRCKEVVGDEKTTDIFNGIKKTGELGEVEEVDENGKAKKMKSEVGTADGNGRWSFIFSEETSTMWSKDHMYNQQLFSCQEADLNRMLDIDGAVTVNDALKKLGITRTKQGQRDGWIAKEFGGKDGYVQIRATLLDYRTETYLIELNIDGNIENDYEKALIGTVMKRR